MTEVSSSSESTGPFAASSSSRGALASIAASTRGVSLFELSGEGTYSVASLGSSSDML